MSFTVPAPGATHAIALDDGAEIRLRRHGNFDAPTRLLVTHGNGFAADAYLPFWQLFLADCDLVVYDFRNHGRNTPATPSNHNYVQLTRDLDRIVRGVREWLDEKPTVGVFHSMSARTAMKHAVECGWMWDALVLFDPPNVPPTSHPAFEAMRVFENRLTEWAIKRRRKFASVEELAQEYRDSRATVRWVEGAHDLMARSVLRPSPDDDGFELVCAPENEANIYAEALTLNLWPPASVFGGPVKLIGADPDLKGTPATAQANRALGTENGYDYEAVAGAGHMMQIEKPDQCAALVRRFMAACNLK